MRTIADRLRSKRRHNDFPVTVFPHPGECFLMTALKRLLPRHNIRHFLTNRLNFAPRFIQRPTQSLHILNGVISSGHHSPSTLMLVQKHTTAPAFSIPYSDQNFPMPSQTSEPPSRGSEFHWRPPSPDPASVTEAPDR